MITNTTKIVIIEDNEVVKDGFTLLINNIQGYEVVNAYICCEDAIKNLGKDQPDIVLTDLELPGINGIQGIQKIKQLNPDITIVVITVHEQSEMVFDALCAGASGYITKDTGYAELLEAIEEVKRGGAPMSRNIARMVVSSFQRNHSSPLTSRETEVLELLAKGKSYTIIASQLSIHKETVKSHIKNIYFKLQVNSKADAIEKALKNKFI
ncbi:response regulator transcription factor [Rapidithrix thailandica]|uniref:Response regulator transcription factor n=1 Tax=Rapidithrix thailandica TaxID=413964 RepID=A0AAW9RZY1_9BACT